MVGEENREVKHDNDAQTLTVRIKEGKWDMIQLEKDLLKIIPSHLILNLEVM